MTDKQSIEVSVQLTVRDAYRGILAIGSAMYRRLLWGTVAIFGIVSVAALYLALNSSASADTRALIQNLLPLLALPIAILSILYLTPFLSARSLVKKNPNMQKPALYSFSPGGVLIEGPTGRAELQWNTFVRIRETRTEFLLYPQKNIGHILPKRCFQDASGVIALRELIRTHGTGKIQLLA